MSTQTHNEYKKKRRATIIGATGLIGGHLTRLLLEDSSYDRVKLLVRRPLSWSDERVTVSVIDFEDEEAFRRELSDSDVVFCAVGTTTRKVGGNRTLYRKVDVDIPVNAARFALESGCKQFVLVSSVGADSGSKSFYLRLKGEAEDTIKAMGFDTFIIMRPSLLLGDRAESRPAEKVAQWVMPLVSFLMPGRLKPIPAETVAKAMVAAVGRKLKGVHLLHYKEMGRMWGCEDVGM